MDTQSRSPSSPTTEACIFCGPDHPNGLRHSNAEIRAYERGLDEGRREAVRVIEAEIRGDAEDFTGYGAEWMRQRILNYRIPAAVAGLNASESPPERHDADTLTQYPEHEAGRYPGLCHECGMARPGDPDTLVAGLNASESSPTFDHKPTGTVCGICASRDASESPPIFRDNPDVIVEELIAEQSATALDRVHAAAGDASESPPTRCCLDCIDDAGDKCEHPGCLCHASESPPTFEDFEIDGFDDNDAMGDASESGQPPEGQL